MVHPVDVHIGKRIRHTRCFAGMIEQQLAQNVGIKFQQIQKYEIRAYRVSASRLRDISEIFEVPVSVFFRGLERDQAEEFKKKAVPSDLMGNKEPLDLIRSYYSIPVNQRRRLFDLARVLSNISKLFG